MLMIKIELHPGGDESKARLIGMIAIANDGTGDEQTGSYNVVASHAGKYLGKRPEPYKTGKVQSFARGLSPYRLLARALKALGET